MCVTAEEAAWSVLVDGLTDDHRVLRALMVKYGKKHVSASLTRNYAKNVLEVNIASRFTVSAELFDAIRREVQSEYDTERFVVGGREG